MVFDINKAPELFWGYHTHQNSEALKMLSTVMDSAKNYLTDLSPNDKPWDSHKKTSQATSLLYRKHGLIGLADRMDSCACKLEFNCVTDASTGTVKFKLRAAHFCRCRHCSTCQWRRAMAWKARFLKAYPRILAAYPKARWLFMTLTVKNCPVDDLRATLKEMTAAWKRLTLRKQFPAIGFSRVTEVTRGADGSAHPHFHVLMMVEEKYFQGAYYLSQQKWAQMWQECLRADYTPVVDVRTVKPKKKGTEGQTDAAIHAAIAETFKYTVKPDCLSREDFLIGVTEQLHKTRAIALGGVLKDFISEDDPENLVNPDEEVETSDEGIRILFEWNQQLKRYREA